MEAEKLKTLYKLESEARENNENYKCLLICFKILEQIQNYASKEKFNVISKLFSYKNQSNFVKIILMNKIIKSPSFIENKETKKKYFQLLIDSFKISKKKDLLNQANKLTKLFQKAKLNNFKDLETYLEIVAIENDSNIFNDPNDNLNKSSAELFSNTDSGLSYLLKSKNYSTKSNISFDSLKLNEDEKTKLKAPVVEKKVSLKKYKPNSSLPMISLSVSTNMNSKQFLELISNSFEKYKYIDIATIKNTDYENIKIFEYDPENCFDYINNFFKSKGKLIFNQFQVSAILKRDENNFHSGINTFLNDIYERKICIKSIKGEESHIKNFIINYLKHFCLSIDHVKIIKQSDCFLKLNLEQTLNQIIQTNKSKLLTEKNINPCLCFKKCLSHKNKNLINEDTIVEKSNTLTAKSYEIFQILSKDEYSLGKTIQEFIESFKKDYSPPLKNIDNLDTMDIMVKIIKLLEFCTNTLNSTYNFDNKYDTNFLGFTSEQFLLNKIYNCLYNVYDAKFKKQNEEINGIQKEIKNKLSFNDLCEKLAIEKKFLGKNIKDPFNSVIQILNQLPYEKYLQKKFKILAQSSLEIHKCILEYTGGEYEIDSMDDELPIIIYISTQLNVKNLLAELTMVDDYIKSSMRDDLVQNKMVTNLLSSLLYLSKSWNSKTLSFD